MIQRIVEDLKTILEALWNLLANYVLVRATNSKLLGTKILEVSKNFRVELENT